MFSGIPIEIIVSVISAVGGYIMKSQAMRTQNMFDLIKIGMEQKQQSSDLADKASERGSPYARKIISFVIIGVFFSAIFVFAFFPDIPVSIIRDIPQKQVLFGLVKWGKTFEVLEINGFFQSDLVRYAVASVIGFFLGTGACKFPKR